MTVEDITGNIVILFHLHLVPEIVIKNIKKIQNKNFINFSSFHNSNKDINVNNMMNVLIKMDFLYFFSIFEARFDDFYIHYFYPINTPSDLIFINFFQVKNPILQYFFLIQVYKFLYNFFYIYYLLILLLNNYLYLNVLMYYTYI